MSTSEATVVIKGRNELSYAVSSAERSLKGLLKQGELIGKLFRGGAIAGAAFAFERLAESAQEAAQKIGDKGTAKALGQLNAEIDKLKSKGLNIIGRVLGDTYTALAGDDIDRATQRVRILREEIEAIEKAGTGGRMGGAGLAALKAELADAEAIQKIMQDGPYAPLGSAARTRAVSRGGGSDQLVRTGPASEPKLAAIKSATEEVLTFAQAVDYALTDLDIKVRNDVIEGVADLTNEMRGMAIVVEDVQAPMAQMTVFAEEAARQMQNIFANWFLEMDNGFKGLLGSFTNMLKQMVAQLLAQQVLNSFFSWGAGLGGWFGSFSKSALAGTRASGGPVMGGSAYLVGERGPELFVPGASGTIIPNGGGAAVHITNNISVTGETDLQRALPSILAQANAQAVAQAKNEIRGDIKRYGRIR